MMMAEIENDLLFISGSKAQLLIRMINGCIVNTIMAGNSLFSKCNPLEKVHLNPSVSINQQWRSSGGGGLPPSHSEIKVQ